MLNYQGTGNINPGDKTITLDSIGTYLLKGWLFWGAFVKSWLWRNLLTSSVDANISPNRVSRNIIDAEHEADTVLLRLNSKSMSLKPKCCWNSRTKILSAHASPGLPPRAGAGTAKPATSTTFNLSFGRFSGSRHWYDVERAEKSTVSWLTREVRSCLDKWGCPSVVPDSSPAILNERDCRRRPKRMPDQDLLFPPSSQELVN